MPYIPEDERPGLWPVSDHAALTPGELNYQLTSIVRKYVEFKGLGYTAINDVLGALEGAKLEFYRRVVAPYEDMKIEQNGDVYDA